MSKSVEKPIHTDNPPFKPMFLFTESRDRRVFLLTHILYHQPIIKSHRLEKALMFASKFDVSISAKKVYQQACHFQKFVLLFCNLLGKVMNYLLEREQPDMVSRFEASWWRFQNTENITVMHPPPILAHAMGVPFSLPFRALFIWPPFLRRVPVYLTFCSRLGRHRPFGGIIVDHYFNGTRSHCSSNSYYIPYLLLTVCVFTHQHQTIH